MALLLPLSIAFAQENEEEEEPQAEMASEKEEAPVSEGVPVLRQDADRAPQLGGAGISRGRKDAAAGRAAGSGAPSSRSAGSGGGAAGSCAEEDLNWRPGKGGPAVSVEGQAMRLQNEDTTIAYRVRASQLGDQGNFGFYSDSHTDSHMRLSSRKCEVALRRGPCEADYGSVTLRYLSAGVLMKLSQAPGFRRESASNLCVIPAPAGRIGGEDYWWLNVHTRGPCRGGASWFGGTKVPEGVCPRAIVYEAHDASGGQAGRPGGGSSGAAPAPAPKPNRCWKARSGRTCCDVMFSPVPSECARR